MRDSLTADGDNVTDTNKATTTTTSTTVSANVSLYQHSCERMAELADGSVDLVITSPLYFFAPGDPLMTPALLRDEEQNVQATYEDLLALLVRCFAEVRRVLKPGGFCAVNVASTRRYDRGKGGPPYPLPFDLCVRMVSGGWELREEIIWRRWRAYDKRAGVLIQKPWPGYYYPNRVFEYLLIFTKPGGPRIYANRTDAEREVSRVEYAATRDPLYTGEIANGIWSILPVMPAEKGAHPCPYPEELATRVIELYSYKSDLVLDPFLGSGTSGKAARLLGRRFVGYEMNPDFLALARQRIFNEPNLKRDRRRAYPSDGAKSAGVRR